MAKRVAPAVPYVVVSIANPDSSHPTLVESPHRLGVLRLAFHDVAASRSERGGRRP